VPAAYTPYKFNKMFVLVLSIFFILAILSVINPVKDKATKEAISELDETGLAGSTLDAYNAIPDPKGAVKQVSGNVFYNLLDNNPEGFFFLALIVTLILFGSGVYLRDVRKFQRGLLR
jgi:hypothetical protein